MEVLEACTTQRYNVINSEIFVVSPSQLALRLRWRDIVSLICIYHCHVYLLTSIKA